jgi:hypothetical protein
MSIDFRFIFLISAFIFYFSGSDTLALTQCSLNIRNAPLCPKSGTQILDNSYPAAFASISAEQGLIFSSSFIEEVMFQQNPPIPIVVTSTKLDYKNLIAKLKKSSQLSATQKKLLEEYVLPLFVEDVAATNWQQDFMEGSYNPNTGFPVVREVKNYFKQRDLDQNYLKKIVNQVEKCGVTYDQTPMQLSAQDNSTSPTSGMFGGNLESLPNGLCIIGTDHFGTEDYLNEYARVACGRNDYLQIPTSFLKVGHADEVISVLPDANKSKPCDFAIALASPRKALELLRTRPEEQLFDSAFINGDTEAFQRACRNIIGKRILTGWDETKNKIKSSKPGDENSVFYHFLNLLAAPSAFASEGFLSKVWNWKKECQNLTNNDLLKYIEGDEFTVGNEPIPSEFKLANESIQNEMDDFKYKLQSELQYSSKNCQPKIIDVPIIYEATYSSTSKKAANAITILPSPANGIRVNDKFMYSKVGSRSFDNYLKETFKNLKANSASIDTYWAQENLGNLHCSSNIIRYCRPRNNDKD